MCKEVWHLLRTPVCTGFALVAFAMNSLLCRLALGGSTIDAASFATIRLGSGAVMLLLIHAVLKGRASLSPRGHWPSAVLLFLYAVAFSLAYIRLSAGTGALILFGSVQAKMIIAAPEPSRMVAKLAASIVEPPSASRQSNEFMAKAISANPVQTGVFKGRPDLLTHSVMTVDAVDQMVNSGRSSSNSL